ncbi:hypothetical protein [Lactococcus lactis]|nr:hypothetical protein [Lactococcus lactis]
MKEVIVMKKIQNILGKLSLIILIPFSLILLVCNIFMSMLKKFFPMLFTFIPVGALTIWIYGEVVALIIAHKFIMWSYFTPNQYPQPIPHLFNCGMTWEAFANWYLLPISIIVIIEFISIYGILVLSDIKEISGK